MAYRDSASIVCADFMSVVRVGLDGSSEALSHLANHPYIVGIARLGESSYAASRRAVRSSTWTLSGPFRDAVR